MSRPVRTLALLAVGALALTLFAAAPVAAQGNSKHYAVTQDRALAVTRDVLVKQGYDVVRVESEGLTQVVYSRRGNQGKGKGKGKLEKFVIRRDVNRIVFVDTPSSILVAIDIRLKS